VLRKAIITAAVVLCASVGSAFAGGWNAGVAVVPVVPVHSVQPYYAPAYFADNRPVRVIHQRPPMYHGHGYGRRWHDDHRRYVQPPTRVVYREERIEHFSPHARYERDRHHDRYDRRH
jgi:hypothetical protein